MRLAILALTLLTLAGCTVHPRGEQQERQSALVAGKRYEKHDVPPLPANPTRTDLVRYALLSNADLEQQYWQWRSAIEQIPIDGTQASNLILSLSSTFNEGNLAADRTIATAANDPMADLVLPNKLSTAAQRSLENARAAGVRFRKAQFELRRKVLSAYDDYALNAESIRLSQQNLQLLQTTVSSTESRNRAGLAGQQDILKARNEVDLAVNDIESMKAQLPIQRAMLNALLNRPITADIPVPDSLPPARPITLSDEQLFALAAKRNPELIALADEIRAKHEDIRLARLQYLPDFDLSAGTDLKGITQTLMGTITIPFLRADALRAAVDQSIANLYASEAMRRQTTNDLAAQMIDDIITVRDADRQLALLEKTILPRARQLVELGRTSYQTGNATLLDLLDNERSLIDIQRLVVTLKITRDKRLLDIESIISE